MSKRPRRSIIRGYHHLRFVRACPRLRLRFFQDADLSFPTLAIFNNRAGYRAGIEDYLFEKLNRLNLETVVNRDMLKHTVKSNIKHATYYQPITCRNLKLIFEEAKKTRIAFDHFIDIGAGKGKACFYAARNYKFRRITGVEFSLGLVKAANRNKMTFGHRNISFLNEDAANFLLPAEKCLIFLFNPFDDVILEKFIANNFAHFKDHESMIAYAYDVHRETLLVNGFRTVFRSAERKLSIYKFRSHFTKTR